MTDTPSTTETRDHELLDFGGGARLERFGDRVTDRPHPAALGPRGDVIAWTGADLRFDRERGWTGTAADAGPWTVDFDGLTLELRATEAGQVGLFPEHAAMLPWLRARIRARIAGAGAGAESPAVLHLFGYTGLATLAMAAAGAVVTHVDASRPAVAWARRNAALSGLVDRPVRWIVDDALAFTEREARRGRRYRGVVLDPPTYGHGPRTGAWRLESDLPAMLAAVARVLDDDGFVLLTAHTPGFGPDRLGTELGAAFEPPAADVEAGDLALTTGDGRQLELGAFARARGFARTRGGA
jgi:23S rRNA (cytosine1962-C5)-methyltransferase